MIPMIMGCCAQNGSPAPGASVLWTQRWSAAPVTTFKFVRHVWWMDGANKFIGWGYDSVANVNFAVSSSDGLTWVETPTNLPLGVTPEYWRANGATYVADLGMYFLFEDNGGGGGGGNLYRSTDGITWTNTGVGSSGWSMVLWSPTLQMLLLMGSFSATFTSTDGITWTNTGSHSGRNNRMGIWSESGSVFVVAYGPNIITSPDSVTWTTRQDTGGSNIMCMLEAGSALLVSSSNGSVWRSTDGGTTWALLPALPIPSSSIISMAYSPTDNALVAVIRQNSDKHFIGVSLDLGNTWSVEENSDGIYADTRGGITYSESLNLYAITGRISEWPDPDVGAILTGELIL